MVLPRELDSTYLLLFYLHRIARDDISNTNSCHSIGKNVTSNIFESNNYYMIISFTGN